MSCHDKGKSFLIRISDCSQDVSYTTCTTYCRECGAFDHENTLKDTIALGIKHIIRSTAGKNEDNK